MSNLSKMAETVEGIMSTNKVSPNWKRHEAKGKPTGVSVNDPGLSENVRAYILRVNSKPQPAQQARPDPFAQKIGFDEALAKFKGVFCARNAELSIRDGKPFVLQFDEATTDRIEFGKITHALVKWAINDPSGPLNIYRGVWLYGAPGTFKTELFGILISFCAEHAGGKAANLTNLATIGGELSFSRDPEKLIEGLHQFNRVFDECGAKLLPVRHYGNEVHPLEYAIEKRYPKFQKYEQVTCLISNERPDEVLAALHERVASRINQIIPPSNRLFMPGTDKR